MYEDQMKPLTDQIVTRNVILAIIPNGEIQHWHTTSGRKLNVIEEKKFV